MKKLGGPGAVVLRRVTVTLALLLAVAACESPSGASKVQSVVDAEYPPKPDDCPIVVYRAGEPGGPFVRVGRLTARIEGPQPPGGDLGFVLPDMKVQACRLGADGLADLTVRRDPAAPLAIVAAQAVRFRTVR